MYDQTLSGAVVANKTTTKNHNHANDTHSFRAPSTCISPHLTRHWHWHSALIRSTHSYSLLLPILPSLLIQAPTQPISRDTPLSHETATSGCLLVKFSHPAYAPRGVPVPVTNCIPIFQYLPGFCCRKLPINTTPRVFSTQSAPNRTTSSFRQSAILEPNPMTSLCQPEMLLVDRRLFQNQQTSSLISENEQNIDEPNPKHFPVFFKQSQALFH